MKALTKFFLASVYASAARAAPDPDAHQRWRILITTNNGHPSVWGVGEFQLYDAADVNHALSSLGATATSSGDNFGLPSATINGVLSSNWLGSGVAGKWLEVQLAGKVNIVKVGLSTISDTTINQSVTPALADIQYYDTVASAWVTKWSIDATGLWTTNAAGVLKTFEMPTPAPVTHPFWRMYLLSPGQIGVWEMEQHETIGGADVSQNAVQTSYANWDGLGPVAQAWDDNLSSRSGLLQADANVPYYQLDYSGDVDRAFKEWVLVPWNAGYPWYVGLVAYSDDGTDWKVQGLFDDSPSWVDSVPVTKIADDMHDTAPDLDPSAAHRYWRFQQEVYSTYFPMPYLYGPGGVDLTTTAGGTASQSDINGGWPYDASVLFGHTGDVALRWDSGSGAPRRWVQWDFGSGNAQVVDYGLVDCYSGSNLQFAPIMRLMCSDDGTNWKTASWSDEFSGDAWIDGEVRTFTTLPSGVWKDSVVDTITAQNSGWGGYTLRNYVPVAHLNVNGDKGRATFKAGSAGLTVVEMFVGTSTNADPTTFQSTPTRVKVAGANGVAVASNADWVTDEFDLPAVGTYDNLLFSWYMSGGDLQQNTSSSIGGRGYYSGDAADDLALPSIGGASAVINYLKKLEVRN